jgi:hypothetical protein
MAGGPFPLGSTPLTCQGKGNAQKEVREDLTPGLPGPRRPLGHSVASLAVGTRQLWLCLCSKPAVSRIEDKFLWLWNFLEKLH